MSADYIFPLFPPAYSSPLSPLWTAYERRPEKVPHSKCKTTVDLSKELVNKNMAFAKGALGSLKESFDLGVNLGKDLRNAKFIGIVAREERVLAAEQDAINERATRGQDHRWAMQACLKKSQELSKVRLAYEHRSKPPSSLFLTSQPSLNSPLLGESTPSPSDLDIS